MFNNDLMADVHFDRATRWDPAAAGTQSKQQLHDPLGQGEPERAPTATPGQSVGGLALLGRAAVCICKGHMQWDNLSLAFLCVFS